MTKPANPLAVLEAFEAAAFRVSQTARHLLAQHPGLPVNRFQPRVWASAAYGGSVRTHAELEISPGTVKDVCAWADALGATAETTVYAAAPHYSKDPFESVTVEVELSGVDVKITDTRSLSADEAAAWRAEQAAEGGEAR